MALAREVFSSACAKLLDGNLSETQAESYVAAASSSTSCFLKLAECYDDDGHASAEQPNIEHIPPSHAGQSLQSFPNSGPSSIRDAQSTSLPCDDPQEGVSKEEMIAVPIEKSSKCVARKNTADDLSQELGRWRAFFMEGGATDDLETVFPDHGLEPSNGWMASFKVVCRAAFEEGLGAQIASQLSRAAPRQCAPWLECLKNLALAVQFATACQYRSPASVEEFSGETGKQEYAFAIARSNRDMLLKSLTSLKWIWSGLKGSGGLFSKHWRTRLAAVQLSAVLSETSCTEDLDDAGVREIHNELLQHLVFILAISDSHWAVRRDAINCAAKVFKGLQHSVREPESDRFLWGFLATSLDKEPEVHNEAVKCLSEVCLTFGIQYCQEISAGLINKFVINTAPMIRTSQSFQNNSNTPEIQGSNDSVDVGLHLAAIHGVINLGWLDSSKESSIPLLVAFSASVLHEAVRSGNTSVAKQVSDMLRSLASRYEESVIEMVSSKSPNYESASIARWFEALGVIDDENANVLKGIESTIILKGLSVALEGLDGQNASCELKQGEDSSQLRMLKIQALLHIIEVLEIPSSLVSAAKDTLDINEAERFVEKSHYLLKIVDAIIKNMCWLEDSYAEKHNLVEGLVLVCATLASIEGDLESPLWWVKKDVCELSVRILNFLGTVFRKGSINKLTNQAAGGTPRLKVDDCSGTEVLILSMLPALIPKFKEQLRSDLSMDKERNLGTNAATLTSAILTAHQMYWCLKQVEHPRLGLLCSLIIPCCLIALDHYSAHVKRLAMKTLLHITNNLNASELRWFKDPVLDCVCRSIIGSGDLWPLVVVMAVRLVTSIEGKNPRGRWYRSVVNEMLGELERHRNDLKRCAAWLEHSTELVEAMGLVFVMYFKRLLPLLFLWLHSTDDSVCILVVRMLSTIIKHTWPRIPFHATRLWQELVLAYKASFGRPSGSSVQSSIIEVCRLLKLCGGPALDAAMQKDQDDEQIAFLVSAALLSGAAASHG